MSGFPGTARMATVSVNLALRSILTPEWIRNPDGM